MVRIGILTFFASINYGAFLQSYALQKCLESEYRDIAEVEVVNYNSKKAHNIYLDRVIYQNSVLRYKAIRQYELFLQSRKRLKLSKDMLITDDLDQLRGFLENKYDILIAGSDEIWKTDSFRGFPNGYWLNFDLGSTLYMAYAVSGRNDYQKLPQEMQKYMRDALRRFVYVGTRDEITRQELLKIEKREIVRNCDPTFLMPQIFQIPEGRKWGIRKKYGWVLEKPVVSIMVNNCEIGTILYRMLKNDNYVINLYNINVKIDKNNLVELSPFEWNEVIGVSDLVITDFFHGMVFSVLHYVPFVALEPGKKGRGKIESFLIENKMKDKFLYEEDYKGNIRGLAMELYTMGRKEMKNCDTSQITKVIGKEREKGNGFLKILSGILCKINKNKT